MRSWSSLTSSAGRHRSTQAFLPSPEKSLAQAGTDRAFLACAAASQRHQQQRPGNPHSRGKSRAPAPFSPVPPPRRIRPPRNPPELQAFWQRPLMVWNYGNAWPSNLDSNQSMHFTCIAFNPQNTLRNFDCLNPRRVLSQEPDVGRKTNRYLHRDIFLPRRRAEIRTNGRAAYRAR